MSAPRRHRQRSAPEHQARAARNALELRCTALESTLTTAQVVTRELVRELVAVARGRSLADVRIPADAAAVLGSRGDKGIREIGNRAGYTVTLTRTGYALAPAIVGEPYPYPTDPSSPAPSADNPKPEDT